MTTTNNDVEIAAMQAMVTALEPCTREQRHRALSWAEERYGATGSLTAALSETIAQLTKEVKRLEKELASKERPIRTNRTGASDVDGIRSQ